MHVRFGDFVLNPETRELRREGRPVPLAPKAFVLLDLLLRSRPRALSRAEIRRRVWPDSHAGDTNLNVVVAELRKALGDDAKPPKLIRTVFGYGYAFAGEAEGGEVGAPSGDSAQPRLLWERKVFPLVEGENILGRDEGATVRIDVPGVSRRHARIHTHQGGATLEDLGSKNGTFLQDERVVGPTTLADGAVFRLGRMVLVYRSGPESGSTLTEATSADDGARRRGAR